MRHTVVGVFDRYAAAEQAARTLAARGFDEDHVHVTRPAGDKAFDQQDEGVMGHVRSFFAELFGPDDEAEVGHYAKAVQRGGAVVRVEVEEEAQAADVQQALQQAGAVDVNDEDDDSKVAGPLSDTKVSDTGVGDGGSVGTAAATGTALPYATRPAGDEIDRAGLDASAIPDAGTTRRSGVTGAAATSAGTDEVIPVVREDIEVGKRTVSTGGVRVYARTVEEPVHESVELRSEHAVVARRPVDRPASEADLAALQDRSIEVEETAEKAVVSKTARVVEEVVVGKTAEHRTERIDDSVRRTEVEVQRTGGADGRGMLAGGTAGDTVAAGTGATAHTNEAMLYREDFESNYAGSGGRWEDYEPAYRHGNTWAADPQYQGKSWDEVEPHARSAWERDNPGSTWERMKGAVKHGWQRM